MSVGYVVDTPTVYEPLTAYARRSCEPPYAAGVRAEQPLTLACRCAKRDRLRRRDPDGKRCRERADWPIAAPDHPIPAEAFDRMLDVRSDVVDSPGLRLGVGDDARDLDRDVGPPGDFGDLLSPRMLRAVLDRRHAAVIKNKLDRGRKVGEGDRPVN